MDVEQPLQCRVWRVRRYYFGYTGITWHFFKHWAATVYGKYTAFDIENGSKGDADWYLYDVDEYGAGLSVLVTW